MHSEKDGQGACDEQAAQEL